MYLERFIKPALRKALSRHPVVLLRGARQTGKTTLMQQFREEGYRYISFDNFPSLLAAREDPVGYINELSGPTILDEIQRVPELFLPIKEKVDKERISGQFLLTGSADPLLLPNMGDSLAGRMRLLSLYPLSEGEKQHQHPGFMDQLWEETFKTFTFETIPKKKAVERLFSGGYPAFLTMKDQEEKMEWLGSYTSLILQKDVTEIARVDHFSDLPRLLALLANRTGGLLQMEELGRTLQLSAATVKRYLSLLEVLFLYQPLPAWHGNFSKRLVKSPKIYLNDVSLITYLLALNDKKILEEGSLFGEILENFVFNELQKTRSWSEQSFDLYHLRDYRGGEIDFILEKRGGELLGIEVKGRETVRAEDFKVLKNLQEEQGEKFKRGFVLYLGNEVIPFGKELYALPLSALWTGRR